MTELEKLERDVADARLRVRADLQRLRAPHVSLRDEITTGTRRSMDDYRDRFLTNLKDRLAANPVATAAIAAGLAWRLVRRPPIATMLIGGGLWSLLRTEPVPGAYDHAEARARAAMDDATDWAQNVKGAVQDRAEAVRDAARQAADTVKETAARGAQMADQLRASAAETARAAADTVRETAARGSESAQTWHAQAQAQAEGWREQAQTQVQDWRAQARETGRAVAGNLSAQAAALRQRAPQVANAVQQNRDGVLLGLASVAVVAAVGIAAQRRLADDRLPPR
jgi:gas vesicle protein